MGTLVLTTLLVNGLGLVAIVLRLTIGTFVPDRHVPRPWVRSGEQVQRSVA